MSNVVLFFFELLGSFALCLRCFWLFINCIVLRSFLLCLFQVVYSVFIVSVRGWWLLVVLGCSLFRLFQAISV